MRIGAVAQQSGLSARMIRYYEARDQDPRPGRDSSSHRTYSDEDVARLRVFRVLLAAGLTREEAFAATRQPIDDAARRRARAALDELIAASLDARRCLSRTERAVAAPAPENRIGLLFDLCLARTRAEVLLNLMIRQLGVVSTELGILDLIWADRKATPASLARLIGQPPSTLNGRLNRLTERGLIQRRTDRGARRPGRLELTPAGLEVAKAALDPAAQIFSGLQQALQEDGLSVTHVQRVIRSLSAALRRMMPEPGASPTV
jgi:DNA-binding transcriptional MerR regulator/DNA-binding MarR family transcriptional regulator